MLLLFSIFSWTFPIFTDDISWNENYVLHNKMLTLQSTGGVITQYQHGEYCCERLYLHWSISKTNPVPNGAGWPL
ncbi:StfH/YfcO family fimbrial adhesin [Escherichia coli]|uniref:StfH/YfcO family fimbrial adhesin n=1 Tax=Escherichia coli TaxID=562 RepID=UPI003EDFF66F